LKCAIAIAEQNAHGLVASVDYRQVLFPISVEIANGHSER
jgi:hypothetical protein